MNKKRRSSFYSSLITHHSSLPPAFGSSTRLAARSRKPVTKPGSSAVGSSTVNVVPSPGVLSTEIVPSCASTTFLAMARPSPVPVSFVEKYGSKILSTCSAAIPSPVSVMETRARPSSAESLTVSRPPRPSIACMPLMIRFVKRERKDSRSPATELRDHLVEGRGEEAGLVAPVCAGDAYREVARGHAQRRARKLAHGARESEDECGGPRRGEQKDGERREQGLGGLPDGLVAGGA